MLRSVYDWVLRLSAHRHARGWLCFVAFVESSVFPVPLDVMLVPMVLADRERAWRLAFMGTVFSVLGGLFGYAIGLFFYESLGRPILDLYGYADRFQQFAGLYNEWGAWIVFIAGVSPFPYKVITIASGVTQLDLLVFTLASVVSRGIRFYAVVWVCWYFGPRVKTLIESNLPLWTTLTLVLLVGGFGAVKYVL
jgi:membrane protein YqaA with SNARE-associated domain